MLVVSHGHMMRVLAARALGLPPDHGRIFGADTASLSVIEDLGGERVIRLWNLTATTTSSPS